MDRFQGLLHFFILSVELSKHMTGKLAPELRKEVVSGEGLRLAVELDLRFSGLSSRGQWICVPI